MNFNQNQQAVINHINGNLVVIASAGSGKTSVLVHRIQNMIENHNINPQNILAITFSRKAKEEMQERIIGLLPLLGQHVNIETFHSLALHILQAHSPRRLTVWTVQWEKEKLIATIMKQIGIATLVPNFNEIFTFFRYKVNHKPVNGTIWEYPVDKLNSLYSMFSAEKEKRGLIEFDDFVPQACELLRNNPEVLDEYRDQFQYILADEYQDVSNDQAEFIRLLNTSNTMVVGDPLQAIYAFRGGNSKFILDFDRDYDDVTVINLNINYRSSADIVNTSNVFADSVPDSKHRNYKPSIPFKAAYVQPKIAKYAKVEEESDKIAAMIKQYAKKYEYSDIAILSRTNAQLGAFQSAFAKYGIPFTVIGGSPFYELPEIKLLLSYLALAYDNKDDEAFNNVYNKPNRWLDKKFLEKCTEVAARRKCSMLIAMGYAKDEWRYKKGVIELQRVINTIALMDKQKQGVRPMIEYLRRILQIDQYWNKGETGDDGRCTERIENMDAFEKFCEGFAQIGEMMMDIKKIDDLAQASVNGVQLLTIHKSKGLEYPVVFVIGCNEGLLPHYLCEDEHDEQRLMYVAITRAKDELHVSYVDYYHSPFVSGKSHFIDDLTKS